MRLIFPLPILVVFLGWTPQSAAQNSECMFPIVKNYHFTFIAHPYSDEFVSAKEKCVEHCKKTPKCVFVHWAPLENRCKLFDLYQSGGLFVLKKQEGPNQVPADFFLKTPHEFQNGKYVCPNPAPNYYYGQYVSIGEGGRYNVPATDRSGDYFQVGREV